MEYFVQQLIIGITLGSIYGLIAIGYTMVYGIIGMINFAHGDVFMVGGFIALIAFLALLGDRHHLGAAGAVPGAAGRHGADRALRLDRRAHRLPAAARLSFRLAPLISAIGMSIILQNYVQVAQGARVKPLPPIITGGHRLMSSEGFDVDISNIQIIVVLTTLVADGRLLLAGRRRPGSAATCAPASRT